MKRVRLALAVLMSLLLFSVLAQSYVDHVTSAALNELACASEYAAKGQYEQAKKCAQESYQKMRRASHIMQLFLHRAQIASVRTSLHALCFYAKDDNNGDFLYEIARCSEELRLLRRFFFSVL